jgi:hypothetical protein
VGEQVAELSCVGVTAVRPKAEDLGDSKPLARLADFDHAAIVAGRYGVRWSLADAGPEH